MRTWLHSIIATPYVRKCFSTITLDDELLELTFELKNSIDEDSDNFFVKDILAQGMVICWMQQKIDKAVSLATVVGAKEAKPDQDFFPLTVNYQEKYYATGKIPGGFMKREGKPSEHEVLVSRLIDRPIRPLFPHDFRNSVCVVNTVLRLTASKSPLYCLNNSNAAGRA